MHSIYISCTYVCILILNICRCMLEYKDKACSGVLVDKQSAVVSKRFPLGNKFNFCIFILMAVAGEEWMCWFKLAALCGRYSSEQIIFFRPPFVPRIMGECIESPSHTCIYILISLVKRVHMLCTRLLWSSLFVY